MSFKRNAELYGEQEPTDYFYKIVRGAVRTYKVLMDGRRQIGAFYLPGEIFGLEAGEEHVFSAEAIVDTKILIITLHHRPRPSRIPHRRQRRRPHRPRRLGGTGQTAA